MGAKKEIVIKKSVIDNQLKSALSSNDAIYAVLLSSIDGNSIALQSRSDCDDSKLAAMTSSCLALGEKIAVESKQNGCDFVIIQNKNGFVALKRVGQKLVLTTMAKESISLGMLLSATRNSADAIEQSIGFK